MDELVFQAMARWPDVPAMFGWLRLDRRGNWFLVERGRPNFDEAIHGLGSPITSPPILDFIGRNYQADPAGRWYWQNGPQCVYVDLDLAPLILRVFGSGSAAQLVSHTGFRIESIEAVYAGPAGELWVNSGLGPGVVHDLDLGQLELEFEEVVSAVWLQGRRHPVAALATGCLAHFEQRPR